VNTAENIEYWSLVVLDCVASYMLLNNFLTFTEYRLLLLIVMIDVTITNITVIDLCTSCVQTTTSKVVVVVVVDEFRVQGGSK